MLAHFSVGVTLPFISWFVSGQLTLIHILYTSLGTIQELHLQAIQGLVAVSQCLAHFAGCSPRIVQPI